MKKRVLAVLLCASLAISGCTSYSEKKKEEERKAAMERLAKDMEETNAKLKAEREELENKSVCYDVFGIAEKKKYLTTGDGKSFGGVAYILHIDKSDYLAASYDDLKKVNDYIGTYEYSSVDRYFTIDFMDGTGIQYAGFDITLPDYGTLDKDFCIVESYGYVKDADGYYVLCDWDTEKPVTDLKNTTGINGIE